MKVEHSRIIRHSQWGSRGWIYQEEIVARRSRYFLDSEAAFRCGQSAGYEFMDPTGPIVSRLSPEVNSAWISDDISKDGAFSYTRNFSVNISVGNFLLNQIPSIVVRAMIKRELSEMRRQ
jgi:hypothetical protein